EDARLLAAGQAVHRELQLLGTEEKALRPGRDVDAAALEGDRVTNRRERAAERERLIEPGPILLEADEPQGIRALDHTGVGRKLPREHVEERGLAAAVRAEDTDTRPGRDRELQIAEQHPPAEGLADAARSEQAPRAPLGRGQLDAGGASQTACPRVLELVHQSARLLDPALRLGGARFRPTTQPRDLTPHHVGERLLVRGLPAKKF